MKTFLTDEEIISMGLKSGIEIHQQLEGKKLFCDCPTNYHTIEKPNTLICLRMKYSFLKMVQKYPVLK